MPVDQALLLEYAARAPLQKSAMVVEAARVENKATAFLCHSHKDQRLAKGVQGYLQDKGWQVYIDWEDLSMPDQPNRATAERIKKRIRELTWFLFLATENSTASRWCPWEIGYADGTKKGRAIQILQTRDNNGQYFGNEYLQLYDRVELSQGGRLGSYDYANKGRYLVEGTAP